MARDLARAAEFRAYFDSAISLSRSAAETQDLRQLVREMARVEADEVASAGDSARVADLSRRYSRLAETLNRQATGLKSRLTPPEQELLSAALSASNKVKASQEQLLQAIEGGAATTEQQEISRQAMERAEQARQLFGTLVAARDADLDTIRERNVTAHVAFRYGVLLALLMAAMSGFGTLTWAWRAYRSGSASTAALNESHVLYRRAFDATPTAIIVSTRSGTIHQANVAALTLFGFSLHEILHVPIERLLPQGCSLDDAVERRDGSPLLSVRPMIQARKQDGSAFLAEVTSSGVTSPRGELLTLSIVRDITARQMQDEELRETHRKLADTLQRSREQTALDNALTELIGLLQSCQTISEAESVLRGSLATLTGAPSGALSLKKPADRVFQRLVRWGAALSVSADIFDADECWALRRAKPHYVPDAALTIRCAHLLACGDGGQLCVPLSAQGETFGVLSLEAPPGRGAEGRPWAGTIDEIAGRLSQTIANILLREELQRQSTHDSLTGLSNRRYMEAALERETYRAARSGRSIALALVDLDHFKAINDSYGHQAGDALLQAFGTMLSSRTRHEDIACRYGGEEFLVVLTDTTSAGAQKYAELLRKDLQDFRVHHGGVLLDPVTVSIGVSVWQVHGTTAQELLAAADRALYRAKMAGRNRVVVFEQPPVASAN